MDDQTSPYMAPQSGMTEPPPEAVPQVDTPIPKVFGIIHIVYAGLGVVGAAIGVGAIFVMKAVGAQGGDEVAELGSFLEAYDKIAIYAYIDAGLKLILGITLLIAGVGLLKKKLWAKKLSITWAVVRMITAIVMVFLTYGASLEMQESLSQQDSSQFDEGALQSGIQGVSNVLGVIFLSIYPIVTIIFLSKKSVRDYLR